MLTVENEKSVGDRIRLAPLGVGSVTVGGTITSVRDSGKSWVSYSVLWDDGLFPEEFWSSEDFADSE